MDTKKRLVLLIFLLFAACNQVTPATTPDLETPVTVPATTEPAILETPVPFTETVTLEPVVPTAVATLGYIESYNYVYTSGCHEVASGNAIIRASSLWVPEYGLIRCALPEDLRPVQEADLDMFSFWHDMQDICSVGGKDPIEWETLEVVVGDALISCRAFNETMNITDAGTEQDGEYYQQVENPVPGSSYFWFTPQAGCVYSISDSTFKGCWRNAFEATYKGEDSLDMTRVSISGYQYHLWLALPYERVP